MLQTQYDIDKYDALNVAWSPVGHANTLEEARATMRNLMRYSQAKYRIRQKNDGTEKLKVPVIIEEAQME